MSKHTKGPWKNFSQGRDKEIVCCQDERVAGMLLVATVETLENHHGDEFIKEDEMHANAQLIAAAPDLLEALEILNSTYKKLFEHFYKDACIQDQEVYSLVQSTLKKARGEK